MYRFTTKQNKQVILQVHEQGVNFLYFAANGKGDGAYQVCQSWSNVHALLSKLRKKQTFSAPEHCLSAWQEQDELNIRFRAVDMPLAETLLFSKETTAKFLAALGSLPCLN
jgi:hypothetical protein